MRSGDVINGEKGIYELLEPFDRRYVFLAQSNDSLYVVKGFGSSNNDFEVEASAYRAIKEAHPNIVRPHEIIDNDGYIVLPYLRGETIDELIRRDGPMPLGCVLSIFESVCAALAHLHSYGISHGDVHTGNIMLTPSPILIDFGTSDDDKDGDIRGAAMTLYTMLRGRDLVYGPSGRVLDDHLDGDIANIIKNALTEEYESIEDMWIDLEELT